MSNEFGTLLLQISPKRIGFIKFILEGYDGMALVSTLDPQKGAIVIRYPLSFHDDLTAIIVDLSPVLFEDANRDCLQLTRHGGYREQSSFFTPSQH